ncbi:unnamed protein product [Effrenium voratum]|uniref:Uncharacterized protein n=1 Tax=Effrenium voratum TaxID=2562239 RepID=A0AA36JK16_9DINO|nr:unnamed protein product [Effrenium voratum]
MPPVAYKRGWVASAAPGVLETALAEADPSGACAEAVCEAEPAPALEPVGVAVGSEEVAWRREEDAWVLSIPACSADEVTLDTSAEALRVGSRRVAWPRPVSQREADGCVARFSRKRQVLIVKLELEAKDTEPEVIQEKVHALTTRLAELKAPEPEARARVPRQSAAENLARPTRQDAAEAENLAAILMLHSTAALGNAGGLQRLLASKCLPDAPDECGATALEKACLNGHEECARLLLEFGAKAKGLPGAPSTPLHRAAICSTGVVARGRLLRLLLEYSATPDCKDSSGRTAAELAADGSVEAAAADLIRTQPK